MKLNAYNWHCIKCTFFVTTVSDTNTKYPCPECGEILVTDGAKMMSGTPEVIEAWKKTADYKKYEDKYLRGQKNQGLMQKFKKFFRRK